MLLLELTLAIILGVGFISYLIIENYYMKNVRKHFDYVIHVNGTRGKSTVTRLIGTMLRNNGFQVFTKVTGARAVYIDPSGNEKEIKRIGNPNIKEQLKMMRLAKKMQAKVLVIECMAVNPFLQNITQNKMLDANMTVITNARLDHEDVMGNKSEDIIKALGNTIPKDGKLFIPKELKRHYQKSCLEKNTEMIVFESYAAEEIDPYKENVGAALAVLKHLGVNKDKALKNMENYPKDIGVVSIYQTTTHLFINGFSINDVYSIGKTLAEHKRKFFISEKPVIVINNRLDRPFRSKQHCQFLKEYKPQKIIVAGSHYTYFKRKLKGIEVTKYKGVEELKNYSFVFGMGNIKGEGLKIIKHYQQTNHN